MVGMQTNGKKKLRKALKRVQKVVIMDIRKQLEQQRKWKAEVVKRKSSPAQKAKQAAKEKKQAEASKKSNKKAA